MPPARRTLTAQGRQLRDPFADRASLISRTLLANPGTVWTVRGLAEAAGVAPMLSSDVIRQLAASGIVATAPRGRQLSVRLVRPQALLDEWTAAYRWTRNVALQFAVATPNVARTLTRLARAIGERRWALTLLMGAWQRIQYAPTERIHLYMECEHLDEIRDLAEHEGWPHDPSGSLVIMRPTYRTSVWHGQSPADSKHPPVVSDIQLILDLWHHADRGRETAEQLWRPILRRFEAANAPSEKRRNDDG
jgi:hypothetical protein